MEVSLADLIVPILLSGVFVFIASSIIHMATPMHKGDYKKLPGEAEIMSAMREQHVEPGAYMFPCAGSMKEMGSPEMIEKMKQGPVGLLQVQKSGPPNMGMSLFMWFIYTLVIGLFVAYACSLHFPRGSAYSDVFRFAGTVAILAYATANIPNSVWKGQSWMTTLRFIVDGVIYGLLTAGTMGWMWPALS